MSSYKRQLQSAPRVQEPKPFFHRVRRLLEARARRCSGPDYSNLTRSNDRPNNKRFSYLKCLESLILKSIEFNILNLCYRHW